MIPLFEHYPLLGDEIPYVSLGEFPTPIKKLDRLGQNIGLNQLYIKRDDLSGKVYGGNKLRKLEFILGHALHTNAKEVLTFGFVGSNHALATAIYARQVGLRCVSMLIPQPNAHYVRCKLLMSHYCMAELHQYRRWIYISRIFNRIETTYQLLLHKLKYGNFPQVIPWGGTSVLGTIGFVNAAFELKEQINDAKIPEPDYIYVAMGTMGTAVGLMIGLKAANLKTRVIPVPVVSERIANANKFINHFHETNSLLHSTDLSFPSYELSEKDIDTIYHFFRKRYILFTKEVKEAMISMEKIEGIKLDEGYTGKVFTVLINDAEKQDLRNKTVLFWNTCNSRDFSEIIKSVDYRQLPQCFHRYFEEDVQAVERFYE